MAKETLNTLDKLMQFNPVEVKLPTDTVKRKLAKLDNMEIEFELKALTNEDAARIQNESMTMSTKTGLMKLNSYGPAIKKLLAGCKLFSDKELIQHFGCATPRDLIDKILTKGDMDFLTEKIDILTGYDAAVKEEQENELMDF